LDLPKLRERPRISRGKTSKGANRKTRKKKKSLLAKKTVAQGAPRKSTKKEATRAFALGNRSRRNSEKKKEKFGGDKRSPGGKPLTHPEAQIHGKTREKKRKRGKEAEHQTGAAWILGPIASVASRLAKN